MKKAIIVVLVIVVLAAALAGVSYASSMGAAAAEGTLAMFGI